MAPEVPVPDPAATRPDPTDPLAPPAAWNAFVAFYPVADLAATRDFYERELGLELARDQGGCLIFRAAGRGFVGFCGSDEPAPRHPGVILAFATDDVRRVYRRLRAHGVETEGPPRDHPDHAVTHVFAIDPDGYRVEVRRFHDPLP